MRTRTATLPGIALAMAFALTACGGGGDDGSSAEGGGGGDVVTVATTEFAFDPDSITIDADTDVTVELDNTDGGVEHDFTIDDQDVQITVAPGEVTEGTVNVPAGDYTVYCSVAGHREAGMEATLTAS